MFIDTSFCVDFIREQKRGDKGAALTKLKTLGKTKLYISIFTLCELRAGAELSNNPKTELRKVDNFLTFVNVVYPDFSFSIIYGETEAILRKNGTPIPVMDLLIGCTAKLAGMPILTKDTEHFDRIPGLVVEAYT